MTNCHILPRVYSLLAKLLLFHLMIIFQMQRVALGILQ